MEKRHQVKTRQTRKKAREDIVDNKKERLQNNPSLQKAISSRQKTRHKKIKKINYWMQGKLK